MRGPRITALFVFFTLWAAVKPLRTQRHDGFWRRFGNERTSSIIAAGYRSVSTDCKRAYSFYITYPSVQRSRKHLKPFGRCPICAYKVLGYLLP